MGIIISKKCIAMGAMLISIFALQACGSSGSSSNGTSSNSSIATPTTPTPTSNSSSGSGSGSGSGSTSSNTNNSQSGAADVLNPAGSGFTAESSADTADAGLQSDTGLNSSASVTLDSSANPAKGPTINVKTSGDNTLVTMGDTTYTLSNNGSDITDGDVTFFEPRTMVNTTGNYQYAKIFTLTKENGELPGANGLVIFSTGAETPEASLPTTNASATYEGQTELVYVSSETINGRVSGDIALDVNFANKTVDATMNNFIHEDGASNGVLQSVTNATGEIKMQDAAISGNSYSGNLTGEVKAGTRTLTVGGTKSNLAGKFFGPNAEETAGIIQVDGLVRDGVKAGTADGVGSFIAKQKQSLLQ